MPIRTDGVIEECFNDFDQNTLRAAKNICIVLYTAECETQNAIQHFLLASNSHSFQVHAPGTHIAGQFHQFTWIARYTYIYASGSEQKLSELKENQKRYREGKKTEWICFLQVVHIDSIDRHRAEHSRRPNGSTT